MKLNREAVYGEWRKWFAWYPVKTVDYEWVWLETVERKIYNAIIQNVIPSSWIINKRIELNK